MSRTRMFDALRRTIRIARDAEARGISTSEAIDESRDASRGRGDGGVTRRQLLGGLAVGAGALAMGLPGRARAASTALDVGIVGAGLAGLVCADKLLVGGTAATLYEASSRVGGRQFTLRGFFPGQVAERGGELIDNLHKTMLGYAREFGLTLEDMGKQPGEVFYFFDGRRVPEADVVDAFRAFVPAMKADLRRSTGKPTADAFNDTDLALDRMGLDEYMVSRGASRLAQQAIGEAYLAEYGLELAEQSALNYLLFVHADKRSKFTPYGVFSDERYHIVEGNDSIATGIANKLRPGQLQLGHTLERVARTAAGRIELTFRVGSRAVVRTHDAVVLAIPFSVLRTVDLDASLGLPAWKTTAIRELGYGTNAKMMVGFDGPMWGALGSNGASYSDLADHQATWETNPSLATSSHAVLTDYSSGVRGASLRPERVQAEADRFVRALDRVYPGAYAAASRDRNSYRVHLEHWPSNPLTRGSYTCYRPGQFTTIAGNEGKRVGNLLFAGEHTNSFYDWQGFMEGACLSGIDASLQLLKSR